MFRRANKFIDETAPWILAKDESKKDRLETVLYELAESVVTGVSLLEPFMPDTAAKAAAQFGEKLRSFEDCQSFGKADVITVSKTPEMLFARIDAVAVIEKVEAMINERKNKREKRKRKWKKTKKNP